MRAKSAKRYEELSRERGRAFGSALDLPAGPEREEQLAAAQSAELGRLSIRFNGKYTNGCPDVPGVPDEDMYDKHYDIGSPSVAAVVERSDPAFWEGMRLKVTEP